MSHSSGASEEHNQWEHSAGADGEGQRMIPFSTRSWRSVTDLLPVLVLPELVNTLVLLVSGKPAPCSPRGWLLMATCATQAVAAAVVLFSRGSAGVRDVQVEDFVTQGCLMLRPFFGGSLSPSGSVLAWQSLAQLAVASQESVYLWLTPWCFLDAQEQPGVSRELDECPWSSLAWCLGNRSLHILTRPAPSTSRLEAVS